MLHWLHSLLPHIPRYGYVLVFIVVLLNNIGVPLPGETILLGAGFILGESREFALGTHGGWNRSMFPGRHLFLLAGTAVGP
jgi:membrane protein DedA with SNARE-associated domain